MPASSPDTHGQSSDIQGQSLDPQGQLPDTPGKSPAPHDGQSASTRGEPSGTSDQPDASSLNLGTSNLNPGTCSVNPGACSAHPAAYGQQLAEKEALLRTLFAGLDAPAPEVFASAPTHYRMRAEFRVWHEEETLSYAMFEGGQKASRATLRTVEQFEPACASINALMPRLLAAAQRNPVLGTRWHQVEFLATLSGEVLVTMIYHRRLDEAWEAAARALQAELGVFIIGRSKGQKLVLSQDFVTERLHVPGAPAVQGGTDAAPGTTGSPQAPVPSSHPTAQPDAPAAQADALAPQGTPFLYRQPEGAFTQPNARMCEQMIGWACRVIREQGAPREQGGVRELEGGRKQAESREPGGIRELGGVREQEDPARQTPTMTPADTDLLELYCGNGNFTLPLSRLFRRALATEVSKTSVQAAQWNITANACDNVRIARLSAEEFTEAMQGVRSFRRLREQEISLPDYRFSTVLVDPPRAGVDDATLALLQRFDHILYISCNPHTLRQNLDTLCQTHRIRRLALFDQFPFTPHIESGVLLVRRQG